MRFWLLSLLITFSTSTYASLGGSEAGNGTDDLKPDVGTAWFLGHDKKIRYCFELGANFPVARQDVSDILKQVFKQWFDYLEKTGVLALAEKSGTPFATAVSLVDCRENPDLKFLLGTDSPDSQSQKEFYQDPLAFAVRTYLLYTSCITRCISVQ